jgi:hypothetical protein
MSYIDTHNKGISVKELIKMLRLFNPELPVVLMGCDCWGSCDGARADTTGNGEHIVLLTRPDGAQ